MNLKIYSKPQCPFCDRAKALADSKGIKYTEVMLDVGQAKIDGKSYISREELLALIPTARTMPQIMIDEIPIGGYTELAARLA